MPPRTSRRKLPAGESPGRTVQSVDRAIDIVTALAEARDGLSLSKLAGQLDLPPQTAQSLVRTLQVHRWVAQPQRRGPYYLGPALGEIHRRWLARQDCVALARPILAQLSERIGEYVVLAKWTFAGLVPLLEVRYDRELAVRGELFSSERVHAMATGKLLLAMLDEPRRRQAVAALPLKRLGPNSVTDPETLLEQLKSISSAGMAVCVDEAAAGIVALAVPVPPSQGHATVAVGTSLPKARYPRSRRAEPITLLGDAARRVAAAWE